ncbi:MAG: hypothetical protein SFY56_08000 [Bacteroidota bacterium]|nr:hypothetical protein [Bacteroidota bacterium]
MKKIEQDETPLLNVERHPLVIIVALLLCTCFIYLTFITIFKKEAFEVNPLGFFLFVPTLFICFQTLWFILNPYGLFYEDRFEVKKSFLSSKQWYFIDIKKVGELKSKGFIITYNDDEMERIKLTAAKPAHKKLMRDAFLKYVNVSLQKRASEGSK